jgi:hypothetical protein
LTHRDPCVLRTRGEEGGGEKPDRAVTDIFTSPDEECASYELVTLANGA